MKKISVVVHQNYVEDVIKDLHETGLVQIIDISKEEPEVFEDFEKAEMHPEASICSNYDLRLTRLIDILKDISPKPSGINSMLNPLLPEVKNVEECNLDDLYSYAEGVLEEIEKKILSHKNRLKTLDEKRQKIKSDMIQFEYLKDFDFDISDIGESKYLVIKIGKTVDVDGLKNELKTLKNSAVFSKSFGTGKNVEYVVVVVVYISEKEKLEKITREFITEFNIDVKSGRPKDVLKKLSEEDVEIKQEKKKITLELKKYAKDQLNDLLAIREEIQIEEVQREISKNFAKTNSTYMIKGWVLEKHEEKLKNLIQETSNSCIVYESKKPSPNPDKPPTFIETPRWANGFKSLLEMFATPKYNEVNPTISMGIFFILFFGIMLGDAGYGLVILVLSLVGYFIVGKNSELIHSWSFMGIWMGLVTTIVGFLTNGFFGNLVPMFILGDSEALFPNFQLFGITFKPLVEPIKNPLTILSIALIFGLVHMNTGIIFGIIQKTRNKKYKEMLTKKFCWIPLQIGGGVLIGNIILGWETQQLFIPAAILVIFGIILLFIGAGPVGFFDITGYVGDWLSYARLLALGLATAGMALAFNVVSNLFANTLIPPIFGMIIIMALVGGILFFLNKVSKITIILLIILTIVFGVIIYLAPEGVVAGIFKGLLLTLVLVMVHLVNLGLQSLGAGVHSLRLQYVEFFNRFYEGGGSTFSPFKITRRYTKIEENKNVE